MLLFTSRTMDEERNKFVRSANMLKKRVTRKEV